MSKLDEKISKITKAVRSKRDLEDADTERENLKKVFWDLSAALPKIPKEIAAQITPILANAIDEMYSKNAEVTDDLFKQFSLLNTILGRMEWPKSMSIDNLNDIPLTREVTVKDLKKILKEVAPKSPVIPEFPDEIKAIIIKAVDYLEVEPNETIIRRDNTNQINLITEKYDGFTVETRFLRTPKETRIIRQVL